MNKTELKNFAVSARRDLLEKVALRAKIFGIDENSGLTIEDKFGQLAVNGETYSIDKKSAFLSLKKQLETKGYEQLIEEVAYTWFNRIIAIRYMEVNDYLPERVNVMSSSTGKVEPDILDQFETMDLDIDIAKTKDLIRQGETESAYRKLFIAQCNALNKILPFMFEKIHDYSELLLPDFLLDSESIIKRLVSSEALMESFTEVEVIGWLYQFYNSEPKDIVFAKLKKNKKIDKYDIPAATQLFTPKWIVQYMVENSLGQLWLEANPESPLKEKMRYYIEPAEQDKEVKQKLKDIGYKNVNLEEVTIIDPCVGSGHILVYAFDLLYQMYEEAGYPSGDIPKLILEKNLFGLDIDDRAAQLASFALIMKAREKSRRILRNKISLNIHSIQETNNLDKEGIAELFGKNEEELDELRLVIEEFIDAKNFGSILQSPNIDYNKYYSRTEQLEEVQLTAENYKAYEQVNEFKGILIQAKMLSSKFDVVITNPPYMGGKGLNTSLLKYVKENFPESKYDLYAVFIERNRLLLKELSFLSMITMEGWMFSSSYEKLRRKLLDEYMINGLIHMPYEGRGRTSLGINFGSVSFILRNLPLNSYIGSYFGLRYYEINEEGIPKNFPIVNERFNQVKSYQFKEIPNASISYWISESAKKAFTSNKKIVDFGDPRVGLQTGDNDKYLRLWFEIEYEKIDFNNKSIEEAKNSKSKWFPYNKGGQFKKWYGNQEYVVNWENDGEEIKELATNLYKNYTRTVKNMAYYFKSGVTWSDLTSSGFSARFVPEGFIFDTMAPTLFFNNQKELYEVLGFINSNVFQHFLDLTITGLHYTAGIVKNLPCIFANDINIQKIVMQNISITNNYYNSSELSWNFKKHPFFLNKDSEKIEDIFRAYEKDHQQNFYLLKNNEEELNRYYIKVLNLNAELDSMVEENRLSIKKTDSKKETKTFLSYFIGCVMGRYSLDMDGITYAGGIWDNSKYTSYIPNKFGLIQLTNEHYFEDDIITRLREFLSITFGAETVEESIQWLAEAIEIRHNQSAEDRLRTYFFDEFFKDHCQVYQKRPIYWLVDSGKEKGLRTLIYMHRYKPDTMATIRFEHLQEIQSKYNNEIAAVDLRIVNPNLSATEKRDLEKRKTAFQKRLEELLEFDKKLAEYANAQIAIDLDDGVKVNYERFDKVLAKIK